MIKLTFCLHRLPHLSLAQFQDYWRNQHAPLVRSNAGVLRIRRYVQSHTLVGEFNALLRASRGAPDFYDGVAELWWDSLEEFQSAGATPEGRVAAEALLEDERKFIDLSRSPIWISSEFEVVAS